MKFKKSMNYGIGALVVDGLLILETANDLRTGRLTWAGFCIIVIACITVTILLLTLVRRRRKKERDRFRTKGE